MSILAFISIATILAVVLARYRQLMQRSRRSFSSFGVEKLLARFDDETNALERPGLEVRSSWMLGSGDAIIDANPLSAVYTVRLKISSAGIPPFLRLAPSGIQTRLVHLTLWSDEDLHQLVAESERDRTWTAELLKLLPDDELDSIARAVAGAVLSVLDACVSLKLTVGAQEAVPEADRHLRQRRDLALKTATSLASLGPRAAAWLEQHARTHQVWQRRLAALDLLCLHYPDDALTHLACERALAQGHPGEQVRAALALGHDRVLELPADLDPSLVPVPLWAEALDTLVAKLPRDRLAPLLQRSLSIAASSTLRRVLAGYRRLGTRPDTKLLARLASAGRDVSLLLLVVDNLGRNEDPAAEPALLSLFARSSKSPREQREELQQILIRALARAGTARAVPVLREAAKDLGTSQLRQACENAVMAIQARLEGVAAGGLAVVDVAEGGALSISDQGGELAVADEGAPGGPGGVVEGGER